MDIDISNLDYSQLTHLRKQIGDRMTEMRETAITQLRATIAEQASLLNVPLEDLMPKKISKANKATQAPKYRNPDSGETWGGRGHRPQWIKDALDGGRQLEEFLVAS
jgi:DNA-binding protein H-NS